MKTLLQLLGAIPKSPVGNRTGFLSGNRTDFPS